MNRYTVSSLGFYEFPSRVSFDDGLLIVGSAPDIAGKGIANPVGMILSVAMMLKYSLSMPDEAASIESAVSKVIEAGVHTPDLGGSAKTKEFGDAVVASLLEESGKS